MNAKLLILVVFACLLAGCSRYVVATNCAVPMLPYQINGDDAEIKLTESAVSISKSLNSLAELEKAAHPCVRLPAPIDGSCYGLGCPATIDWVGPVEPLLKRIAQATGYCLRVLGREPAIPAIVTINSKNCPFSDILRNISLQVYKKACLAVYPRSRIIELRYSP